MGSSLPRTEQHDFRQKCRTRKTREKKRREKEGEKSFFFCSAAEKLFQFSIFHMLICGVFFKSDSWIQDSLFCSFFVCGGGGIVL